MKIGIVGSRNFTDYISFCKAILLIFNEWNIDVKDVTIVSGGCRGTDKMGERFAKEYSIPTEIYYPDWTKGGRPGIERNTDIIRVSDRLIAFPSRRGSGTQDSINKAISKNISLRILYID